MSSLWGSKKDDRSNDEDEAPHDNGAGQGGSHSAPSQEREPDERTRLIPREHREPREGYLSPDDPAVSPYNLWSVRAFRYFSVLFLGITSLWWVLLFVSIFVSPPGMHSRGSGFFDVSYTTLSIGNILVGLLFFSIPSKPMEALGLTVSIFLLVDMIIILAVGRLRLEEGWVGIASVVWATFIGLYNVIQNRTVAWGKREEEERLTGREETRRSLKEWLGVLTETILMIVLTAVSILLTATLILRARDASLPVPGTRYFVDGDKYQVHLACVGNVTYDSHGNANPTVLVEAGEDPVEWTLEPFINSAYNNGTIERYCYWDRPGFAFSDNAPSPHSAGMSTEALSEALAIAGEEGPWILVSAGIGSIHSRIFSARHLRDVKGLLLIDPWHEDLLHKLAAPSPGFLLWGRGFISPLGIDRLVTSIFSGRNREDRVYGRSAWRGGKYIKAKLQENLVADSLTRSEVSMSRNIQSPEAALVVVSSGIEVRKSNTWESKQKDLTTITENLLAWDVVKQAPHRVWETKRGRDIIEKRLGELVAF